MHIKRLGIALLALAACGAMLGCSDGGSSAPPPVATPSPPEAPPAPPAAVDFTGFVTDQFAATADTTDPEQVDDKEFDFKDEDNPDAYSGLFSNP